MPDFSRASGATLVVADGAAHLLSALNQAGIALATGITVTGTSNVVTFTQAETLAALPGFNLASGATLEVLGTAAQTDANIDQLSVLASAHDITSIVTTGVQPMAISYGQLIGDAPALALITSPYSLDVTLVPAIYANAMLTTPHVAAYTVSDNATNLLNPSNAAGVAGATSVTLVGNNSGNAAMVDSLAALPGFSDPDAQLAITDIAGNLLASAEAGDLIYATSVGLTGTANILSAAEATLLTLQPGFGLTFGATLVVVDSAAHLLSNGYAAGVAVATSVRLTSGVNGVTGAQADTLAAMPNFSLAMGAKLTVSDSAANLLADTAGVAKATKVVLTGTTNSVDAAQATELAGLAAFTTGFGAKLTLLDSASDLLAGGNAAGVAIATRVVITGNANSVDAAQAESLAELTDVAVGGEASLVVSDSAANLLANNNADGIALATAVTLTGISNNLDAADAATLAGLTGFSRAFGADLVITDNAVHLLAIGSAHAETAATEVILSGANRVNGAQAETLAGLTDFTMAFGATLVISDTAADLLSNSDAAGVAKATGVILTGTANVISIAQAATLLALPQFVLAFGASVTIADTAIDLLAPGVTAEMALASNFELTGTSNNVSVAQATALAGLAGFVFASGATLAVSDTAADLFNSANAAGLAEATKVWLTGANNVSAQTASQLAALPGFTLAMGATLVVSDSSADLLNSSYAAGIADATSVVLTGTTNAVNALQAGALSRMTDFTVAAGATLAVSGGSWNVLSSADAAGIADATSVTLTGTNAVTANQAGALSRMAGFSLAAGATMAVSGNAVAILSGTNAVGLAAATSVTLVGSLNTVTAAQAVQLAGLTNFTVASGTKLNVADTAANLSSNLDALQTMVTANELNYIGISDSNPLNISYAQMVGDAGALADLQPGYKMLVSGTPVSGASALWSNWHVSDFTINDTVANLVPYLSNVDGDAKLTGITATGTSGSDRLVLTGVITPITVNLGADGASSKNPLNGANTSFIGAIDSVALGTGNSVIQFALQPSSGIETINNFHYGTDAVDINLEGALNGTLMVFDTIVSGLHAIAITSSTDEMSGVVLLGLPSNETAADLIANHLTFGNGYATIT